MYIDQTKQIPLCLEQVGAGGHALRAQSKRAGQKGTTKL